MAESKLESFLKCLRWLVERYPAFWKWLLPDPPEGTILLPNYNDDSKKGTNLKCWRVTWEWVGVLTFVYILLINAIWWPWSFAAFGIAILCATGFLVGYFSIRIDASVARQALCGMICIWAVFLVPATLWAMSDILDSAHILERSLPSPPVPNPFQHLCGYILICSLLSLGNWAIVRFLPAWNSSS